MVSLWETIKRFFSFLCAAVVLAAHTASAAKLRILLAQPCMLLKSWILTAKRLIVTLCYAFWFYVVKPQA